MIYSICLFAEINSAIGNLQARDSVQHSVIRVTFKNGQVVSVTDGPLIQPFCRIKKESPDCSEDSKEAATYSPTCYCSTIGVNGLNFSVRNGKRWNPAAITT